MEPKDDLSGVFRTGFVFGLLTLLLVGFQNCTRAQSDTAAKPAIQDTTH